MLGVGTENDYSSLVQNQDFIFLSSSNSDTGIAMTGETVITRIKNGKKLKFHILTYL